MTTTIGEALGSFRNILAEFQILKKGETAKVLLACASNYTQ
jgi:hypothetical protein